MKKSLLALLIGSTLFLSACNDKESAELKQKLQQAETQITQLQSDLSKAQTELKTARDSVKPYLVTNSVTLFDKSEKIKQPKDSYVDESTAHYSINVPETKIEWLDQLLITQYFNWLEGSDDPKNIPNPPTKDDLIAVFQQQYQDAVQELKENPSTGMSLNVYSDYIGQRNNIATFRSTIATYTGGAHGMSYMLYSNIDMDKKSILTLDDVILPNKRTALLEILWRNYTEGRSADDIMTSKADFNISPEFYFSVEGINFVYQPYELGSYAEGHITLTASWYELQELINSNYNWSL